MKEEEYKIVIEFKTQLKKKKKTQLIRLRLLPWAYNFLGVWNWVRSP